MAAYVISRVDTIDREAMLEYQRDVPPVVARFGGRYLVRGGTVRALEGTWDHDRMVVVEFPDEAAALAWYHSAEYRTLRDLRQRAACTTILLADGVAEETGAHPS